MNGFLVVLRCSIDDLPLYLAQSWDAAYEFASDERRRDEAVKDAEILLNLNRSDETCVSIWTFKDGVMVKSEVVFEF